MAGRTMGTATTAKQILIADPSETSRRDLLRFFRTKGYKVIETGAGSRALWEQVLLRIQRTLFQDNITESLAGDSEISGNLAQIFLPDLWQILSMNKKSGVIQGEGEGTGGSIYIDQGEIVSARAQNTVGEKALYRLISLREGRFRFGPGKGEGRATIPSSAQA